MCVCVLVWTSEFEFIDIAQRKWFDAQKRARHQNGLVNGNVFPFTQFERPRATFRCAKWFFLCKRTRVDHQYTSNFHIFNGHLDLFISYGKSTMMVIQLIAQHSKSDWLTAISHWIAKIMSSLGLQIFGMRYMKLDILYHRFAKNKPSIAEWLVSSKTSLIKETKRFKGVLQEI